MNLRTVPRTVVTGYLKALRFPVDRTLRLLARDGNGSTSAPELFVDRADAAVRETAGQLLGDRELRAEAGRRRAAAEERERALELRQAARTQSQKAHEDLTRAKQEAEEKRQEAARRAREQAQRAEEQRKAKAKSAARSEQQRKAATRKAAAKTEEVLDERAKRTRLEQLDKQDEALEKRDEALTAKDEAQRLAKAAASAKAVRKSG